MSISYSTEKQVAIAAVRRACHLTSSVFNKLVKDETLTKDDKSPVTVGDYGAQAVISSILYHAFPMDPIVGEEDSESLRKTDAAASELRERITALANDALISELGIGDNVEWGIGPGQEKTSEQLLDAIDRGNHPGGNTGRMWTIDPIDGTKGFLRGEQYAVCVSLIIDAQVKLGVIGCPNLLIDPAEPDLGRGVIFVAVKGHGAEQIRMSGANPTLLKMPTTQDSELSFLESVEAAHSSHSFNERVSSLLNITREPKRMDSQAKYGCLARSEGTIYLRMPTGVGYNEKIWDHAPGTILIEEAGGIVTDSRGQPLDFGLGRTLGENYGVVAAGKDIHARVLSAIKEVAGQEKAKV